MLMFAEAKTTTQALQDTSLDTTDGYCANVANFVDILQGRRRALLMKRDGGKMS